MVDWITFWSGFATVGTFVLFLGVLVWVMSKKRSKDFDQAANLPFEREENLSK
jgi:cytochrome c oxidase cbb3-type subunit IV